MILIQFLFLILPHFAIALSCRESVSVNLSDPGGTLHPLRVTDQNGLGICHIEQLSRLIQARLPGHPRLSRLQLAIAEKSARDAKMLRVNKNAVRVYKNNQIHGTYIDVGNTCSAYELIKGKAICSASSDRFENLTKFNPDDQARIIKTLSSYFDNRKQSLAFNDLAGNRVTSSRIDIAIKACPPDFKIFQRLKASYEKHLNQNKNFLGSDEFQSRGKELSINMLIMTSLQFLSNESYEQHLKKVLKGAEVASNSTSGRELSASIMAYANELRAKESCIANQMRARENVPSCESALGKSTLDLINLTSLGMTIREIGRILEGDNDRDVFFSEAFNCSNDDKTVIPSNITCKKIDLDAFWKSSKSEAEYHSKVDPLIESSIAKGIPVGVSSCTRFFKNPKARTLQLGTNQFTCGDSKVSDYSKGEGSHAMTLIGSRCKNGEKQYLVQNSWGAGCSYYHESFECTGKGGFWAPASVVLNNTRLLNILD